VTGCPAASVTDGSFGRPTAFARRPGSRVIFPLNGSVVSVAQPVFQWTPVLLPPEVGVTYRVKWTRPTGGTLTGPPIDVN